MLESANEWPDPLVLAQIQTRSGRWGKRGGNLQSPTQAKSYELAVWDVRDHKSVEMSKAQGFSWALRRPGNSDAVATELRVLLWEPGLSMTNDMTGWPPTVRTGMGTLLHRGQSPTGQSSWHSVKLRRRKKDKDLWGTDFRAGLEIPGLSVQL